MRPLAVAHRAGNDLGTLRAAVDLGVDVIEADVRAWRGGLEMRHSRAPGPLPLLWKRLGPEGRRIEPIPAAPRLDLPTLLAHSPPGQLLMLDLKGAAAVGPKLAQVLHSVRPDVPVLVCGRWWPYVDAVARHPYVWPVLSARNARELALLRRRLRGSRRSPYGVSIHRPLLSRALVTELHERVEVVMTWPVDNLAGLEEVLAYGVDAVTSDDVEVLRAVLGLP